MDDEVRDVAVHEHLAGREPDDLIGGDAAVRAADPEVGGRLALDEAREELRVAGDPLGRPRAVVLEQLREAGHGPTLSGRRSRMPPYLPSALAPLSQLSGRLGGITLTRIRITAVEAKYV